MNNFKIGQRVVCIIPFEGKDIFNNRRPDVPQPIVNQDYTVSELDGGFIGLAELHPYYTYDETKFKALDESFADEVESNIAKQVKEEELIII